MSHQWQSGLFFLFLCASRITSFLLLTFFQIPCWDRLELFPFLVHCGFCIWIFHPLWHRDELVCDATSKWILCLSCGLRDIWAEKVPLVALWIREIPRFNHKSFSESSRMQSPIVQTLSWCRWVVFSTACLVPQVFPVFSSRFWWISLYSASPGSIKWIPLILLALSSFGFSLGHSCFSWFWAASPIFVQTSGHIWSGLVVAWIFVSLLPDHIYPFGGFSFNSLNLVNLSKNLTNVCSNRHSSNRQCFFLRHIELNSRFIVMTTDEVTLDRPKVGMGFSVICGFCRLRLMVHHGFLHWDLHFLR